MAINAIFAVFAGGLAVLLNSTFLSDFSMAVLAAVVFFVIAEGKKLRVN